jgi:hypothetical protein
VAAFCFIDLLTVSLKVFSVWQPRKASGLHYSATIIGEGIFGNAGMSNETLIRNINTTAQPIIAGVDGVTVRLAATARYGAVNAMLLNECLKEDRKLQEQEATITQLKKEMETVAAHVKEQDSKIQRVSDQLELSKPAPQMVSNDQR